MNQKITKFQAFIIYAVFLLIFFVQTSNASDCGCKKVGKNETAVTGTIFSVMNSGTVKNLKGTVYLPYESDVMKDVVIEVFHIADSISTELETEHSYEEAKKITEGKRKAACVTSDDGNFCFPKLSRGKYMLRIGHRSDGQFSAMHVFVTVDSKDKNSGDEDLKVSLSLSI